MPRCMHWRGSQGSWVTSAYGMATWQPGGFILGKRRLLLLGKSSINGGLSIAVDCRRVSGLPLSNPLGSSHLDPQLSPQLSVGFLQFKPLSYSVLYRERWRPAINALISAAVFLPGPLSGLPWVYPCSFCCWLAVKVRYQDVLRHQSMHCWAGMARKWYWIWFRKRSHVQMENQQVQQVL